jgi:anti-sigma B factor antagonist
MEHADDDVAVAGNGADGDPVEIVARRDGATAVVVLSGEVDLEGGDAIEETVASLVADGVERVSVEARGVTFIDSSGLGGLLAARSTVVDAGGEFHFGPTTENVARVIDVAGVADLLGPAR